MTTVFAPIRMIGDRVAASVARNGIVAGDPVQSGRTDPVGGVGADRGTKGLGLTIEQPLRAESGTGAFWLRAGESRTDDACTTPAPYPSVPMDARFADGAA